VLLQPVSSIEVVRSLESLQFASGFFLSPFAGAPLAVVALAHLLQFAPLFRFGSLCFLAFAANIVNSGAAHGAT
jgi:hypothetical protein